MFNIDLIYNEKMSKVKMLVNSQITIHISKPSLDDEAEIKGYIKALDWVMTQMDKE